MINDGYEHDEHTCENIDSDLISNCVGEAEGVPTRRSIQALCEDGETRSMTEVTYSPDVVFYEVHEDQITLCGGCICAFKEIA